MSMEKLKKCRICLVENVQMYVVANKNLQEIYEKLTDVPFLTEDRRPTLACFICCTKLKQCYQLQRKCLEAEELFAQMLRDDYERTPLINQDPLEFSSGSNITTTMHISKVDECQTERIVIKEELPPVFEGLDDIIEPKEEYQSDELEPENLDNSCLHVADIKPYHSESDLEDDVPLMEFKIEAEEEQEVTENKQRARETKKVELENLDNSLLDVADIQPHHSESDLEDDVPLMDFKNEVEEEQEVSDNKQKAREMKRAAVAKKPKLDTRRTGVDAITAEQTKQEKSDSKVIRTTRKRTSKPGNYFKEPDECDQRSLNPVKKMRQQMRAQTGEKPYKCDVCQHIFSQCSNLKRHILIHTGEKPFKCDVCQRSFVQKCALTKHIRIHTGEKPYKCDVCQSYFNQKGYLVKHIRKHTGEKPYKCDVCERSFSRKSTLIKHVRIHTGEKPYKCDVCQRRFSENGALKNHIRIHTGEKPYKCDVCQRNFNQKGYLAKHIRTHTGGKPFKRM